MVVKCWQAAEQKVVINLLFLTSTVQKNNIPVYLELQYRAPSIGSFFYEYEMMV